MGNEALLQQVAISVETLTTPGPANGTSEMAASDELRSALTRWLDSECVIARRFTTNARILWREFSAWSGRECAQEEFAGVLERRGFSVDRGMVEGLVLAEDFLADIEYERERLRNRKAVQLDLFDRGGQDSPQNTA